MNNNDSQGVPGTVVTDSGKKVLYVPVRMKFLLCILVASLWTGLCIYLADPWVRSLSVLIPYGLALIIIYTIAIVPGFMYMFIATSLLFDARPPLKQLSELPPLTILVPAYNEEHNIAGTVESIKKSEYTGLVEVIVIDDGSTDRTPEILAAIPGITVLRGSHAGKSAALNLGLEKSSHDLIVSVDSDTLLRKNALTNIVTRLLSDPPHTAAVAGAVLVKNSRINLLTRLQEWDYFHGIGSVKRMQSLFQGTLVVQGAFSIYRKAPLKEVNGWRSVVGEDIVLTWALLSRGYRTGFAENAVSFTSVPETYRAFYQQRKRWARGMIEGFKNNPRVFFMRKFSTLFILWNTTFPLLDAMYLFVFIPGVILACFGYFFIAGPLTLLVLPLSLLMNFVMFYIQNSMFASQNLRVRSNFGGFLLFILFYQLILAPASLAGYGSELLSLKKNWGSR